MVLNGYQKCRNIGFNKVESGLMGFTPLVAGAAPIVYVLFYKTDFLQPKESALALCASAAVGTVTGIVGFGLGMILAGIYTAVRMPYQKPETMKKEHARSRSLEDAV